MKKIFLILTSVLFIGCCNKPKLLDNGFTKKVDKVTEYIISVKYDSLNNQVKDTLVITNYFYNSKDVAIKSTKEMFFSGEKSIIEISFVYDHLNKLKKEIVTLPNDTITAEVNYYYTGSLIQYTKSETINSEFIFYQVGNYKYHHNKNLKEISTSHIYIDVESNDTIMNRLELWKYNERGIISDGETIDYRNQISNSKFNYKYKCNGEIDELKEYNYRDSLISTEYFKYTNDTFENWTTRETFENNKVTKIRLRSIQYRE